MRARLRVWREVIWHGGRLMIAFLLGAPASFLYFIRDEILPDRWQNRLHLSALPSLPFWLWIVIVAVLFILLVLEGSYQVIEGLEAQLHEFEKQPRPRIESAEPYVTTVGLYTNVTPPTKLEVARAVVRNNPCKREESATARHVIIKLAFYRGTEETPVIDGEFLGRWTDNDQPGIRGGIFARIDDIRRRDLLPNGEKNDIDLVLKFPNDDACYAFNDATSRDVPGWRDPNLRLTGRHFRVVVTLQGTNMEDWSHEYFIENTAKNEPLRVTNESFTPSSLDTTGSQLQ